MINLIKTLVPKSFKIKIASKFKAWHGIKDKNYEPYFLPQKYIDNVKLLSTREEMLNYLPKNGNVAEIGVHRGLFSLEILKKTNPKKLVLIDIWNNIITPYGEDNYIHVKNLFSSDIESGRIRVIQGDGSKIISSEEDGYFDWIYIDAEHSYEAVYRELRAAAPKLKKGGILSGHDYNDAYITALYQYGVVEAVNEFCMEENWEFIYLTNEPDRALSWAIRKI